jgi:hypothetical protein
MYDGWKRFQKGFGNSLARTVGSYMGFKVKKWK